MPPTQILPPGYRKIGTLDLSKNRGMMIALNILGLFITLFSAWLFFRAVFLIRPDAAITGLDGFTLSSLPQALGLVAAILALTAAYIVLHEAIHGMFFWLFTRARPLFALRWNYAYAAAPEWFIPRNAYLVIALAPLALITLLGLLIMAVAPVGWLVPLWYMLTMNAGGAVGDMAVTVWLLRQPKATLSQDSGDAVSLFIPEAN